MSEDLAPLLKHYGFVQGAPAQAVAVGAGNWNCRVELAGNDVVFVRKHWTGRPRERIEAEHRLIAWVAERGIPVPAPVRTVAGDSVVSFGGAEWAVFPWAEGVPPIRGQMQRRQVFEAGAMHGRIHRVLLDYPESVELVLPPAFDVVRSVRHQERILAVAQEQRAEDWIVEGLTFQLEQLRKHGTNASEAGLSRSPSHGDYHDQQLLFDSDGKVTAVTDWEMFGMRPRAWEVVRFAAFAQILETPLLTDYLSGYREHMALPEEECRLALELWWQGRIHYEWVFHAHFLEANERVAEFLPETLRALRALTDPATRAEIGERFTLGATG